MNATNGQLDWGDMQGNVLRGYKYDHAYHLVLSVIDRVAARRWLRDLLPAITPATPWTTRPISALNLAFTPRGLAAFGVDDEALASFPADFREGMRARAAEHLGDVGPDGPEHWEATGLHDPAAHVLLILHAMSVEMGEIRRTGVEDDAKAHGLEVIAMERLANLPTSAGWESPQRLEHFGFVDGISQPAVEGAIEPTIVEGNGTPLSDGRWRPVRTGEFVLGYPDEEEDVPPLPWPEVLVRNGSYLVYRKLAQDVAAFRRLTIDHAERHDLIASLVADKLVGRRADGSPLVPPSVDAAGAALLNDVRYEDDPLGELCPVGSHVRRANPRDALGLQPELVSRHRLLRRGMPYGPQLAPGLVHDDGIPRGLMFMAYCASICRQFEFVQRQWMNDGNVFGAGHTPDPIAGHGSAPRRFAYEVDGRQILMGGLPRLVRPMGGEFLFQPGMTGLRYLADPHPKLMQFPG